MSGRGSSRDEYFEVPAGRRLVIRHFAVVFWAGSPDYLSLFVHGIPLFFLTGQAARDMRFEEVRFTAYEGEEVRVNISASDCSYAVDGFLFADDDGRPDDADNVITPAAAHKPGSAEPWAGS